MSELKFKTDGAFTFLKISNSKMKIRFLNE